MSEPDEHLAQLRKPNRLSPPSPARLGLVDSPDRPPCSELDRPPELAGQGPTISVAFRTADGIGAGKP